MRLWEWAVFFVVGPGAGVTVYAVWQAVALGVLRGVWKKLSVVSLAVMVVVSVWTVQAYRAEANLWPLGMFFISPAMTMLLSVFLSLGLAQRLGTRRAAGVGVVCAVTAALWFFAFFVVGFLAQMGWMT
jgi:hypothetical protein